MTDPNGKCLRDIKDRIRRFQDTDFNVDLEIRDLMNDVHIPKADLMWISEGRGLERMDRYLFYYIYKVKDLGPFLNALKIHYSWIYNKIYDSTVDKWISDYRRAIRDVPNNQDWNIHRTEYLWEIQKSLKELKRGNYLILFGKLGFGKRWLAADACRDYSVINKVNFKIYWLNVSKCNSKESILDKLDSLKILMNVDDSDIKYHPYEGTTENKILHLREHLRKWLQKKEYMDCLIVLTDVQDEEIIKAFDLNCKMLLTTRHIEKLEILAKDHRKTIDINKGLTLTECQELFIKAMNMKELPRTMTEFIDVIYNICSGHPFIMSIIAKTFQNSNENEILRNKRCDNWIKNLDQYKLCEDIYDQIKMSVDETIKFLDAKQLENYRRMVVFGDNIDIPLDVLSKLWNFEHQSTELLVERLRKYSLLEEQMNGTCSLHYVHYKYLMNEVSHYDQVKYHQIILDKYNVEKIYRDRVHLELDFPDDNYFHYYIGNHLIGAEQNELFDMYLDFGFLEQKIRHAKLANTLGDLKKFEVQIIRGDTARAELLEHIFWFLSTIEQLLFKSRDTTLLQYALTYEDIIKVEARKQASRYPDRVWMNDNLKVENQIIELQDGLRPKIVRFVRCSERDDLVCLTSLQDNNILMQDIATGYANNPIMYKNDLPHNAIIDMQIFRQQAFLVLNDAGKLSVYNLKSSVTRKPSVPTKFSTHEHSIDRHPFIMDNKTDKFTCFSIIEQHNKNDVDLLVGTINGTVKLYRWLPAEKKFQDRKLDIPTKFSNLFRIAYVNEYAMLMNKHGEMKFIDFINSGPLCTNENLKKLENPVGLHQCNNDDAPITICVSNDKVMQITHEKSETYPNTRFVSIKYDDIFKTSDEFDDNKILSSAVSKDFLYIVLGTSKGIIVIDRLEKMVVWRSSVSEQVISLDVYRYPEEQMYFFISVFEDGGQLINLHAFRHLQDKSFFKLKHLVGGDVFDVRELEDNSISLVAVDSKRYIQFLSNSNDFEEADLEIPFIFQIKKICFIKDDEILVGCKYGEVYRIYNNGNNACFVTKLTEEITYLENIDGDVIISTNCLYKILGMNEISGKAIKAYRYESDSLLVVKEDCSIDFINLKTKKVVATKTLLDDYALCIAYTDSLLAIGTMKNNNIYLWDINEMDGDNIEKRSIKEKINVKISYMAISSDKNVLAVGCVNGKIEIYDLNQLIPIGTLESHKRPIVNLVFSPWMENEGSLILLSLAESINFWNIAHVQNNQNMKRLEAANKTKDRVGQRFKLPSKMMPSFEASFKQLGIQRKEKNWSNRTGPLHKPELLSCIKFIGKNAQKVCVNSNFTRFITIDNEGNIYHLRLINQFNNDEQPTVDFNGNPQNGSD